MFVANDEDNAFVSFSSQEETFDPPISLHRAILGIGFFRPLLDMGKLCWKHESCSINIKAQVSFKSP